MNKPEDKYNIGLSIETSYIDEQSLPDQNHYVFAYTITIKNEGKIATKLLRRHWIVTNSDGEIYEVEGEGVIGEQPNIKPGESFSYTSGTVLDTPVGTMHGSFEMLADDGNQLEVSIPTFTLAVPKHLH